MRRAARTDANHASIAEFFRLAGATVVDLSRVGKGCPDLMIGYQNITALVEVKDGDKSPSRRKLRDNQEEFARTWRGGPVCTITDIEGAKTLLRALGE